ncbi:ficolin-1-like isoform X2 [Culex pipiens pallens]|uniref:ficolin-1-like isoform X2 n=2 Tax=Culex pipiens pallens TaxID=42434 RepID=UPI0019549228|nr:ficolin-1-like isoform X2 [Culex pipiens pallens]
MNASRVLKLLVIFVTTAAARDILESQWNPETPAMFKRPKGTVRSCSETSYSGQVSLQTGNYGFDALCVQRHRLFGDGWLVIQQRVDRNEDFYRNWADYRAGFGTLSKGFWMGLENLHDLTAAAPHELAVEVVDREGKYYYGRYSEFSIGSEMERYALKEVGNYSGSSRGSTDFDGLSKHRGQAFSTFDEDNDSNEDEHCAIQTESAWWFMSSCRGSNLNAIYNRYESRILWHSYIPYPLRYSRMMIRKTRE